jgi:RNA polymerase sigma-70 factor (ECF subfamily)
MEGLEVADTVRRAQLGEPAATVALIELLAPWIGRICGSIALDRGDDARQEALLAIVRSLPALREPAALYSWARRIAVREALRQVRTPNEVLVGHVVDRAAIEVVTDPLADEIDVREVLAKLSAEHRAVLVLRYLEDLSEDETSELLDVEVGTVKSRTNRARKSFARKWNR